MAKIRKKLVTTVERQSIPLQLMKNSLIFINTQSVALSMIIVYITCKQAQQARTIAKHLLQEKLIACANIFPVTSLYSEDDTIKEEQEVVLWCKTQEKHYDKIVRTIGDIHSYDIPCVIKLEAEANEAFATWIQEET